MILPFFRAHLPIVAIFLASALTTPAAAEDITGHWSGSATINRDSTRIELDISQCGVELCTTVGLPELGLQGLHNTKGQFIQQSGALKAGLIDAKLVNGTLGGSLSGFGGGMFIDAIPFGQQATIALHHTAAPPLEAQTEPVTFYDGDIRLAGTFVSPKTAGPHPTIVFVHGSGPSTRWYAYGQALALAKLGFASLVYDKRGTGESTGDWTNTSLDDLASDAAAGVDFVSKRSDVDTSRIGLWGHSQGGWVIPRALALGAKANFAVVLAGGGSTPRSVEMSGYQRTLDKIDGLTAEQRVQALDLVGEYFSYLSGKLTFDEMKKHLDAVQEAPWSKALGINRVLPNEAGRASWKWVADYDPALDISKIHIPLLLMFAGNDEETDSRSALEHWNESLSLEQSAQTEIVYVAKATHHFRTGDGGWLRHSPQFDRAVQHWLEDLKPNSRR